MYTSFVLSTGYNKHVPPPESTTTTKYNKQQVWRVLCSMAIASSSIRPLHHNSFPKCPNFSRNSRFRPRLQFSSLRFSSSTIRATSAVALEPVIPDHSLFSFPLIISLISTFHFNFQQFLTTTILDVVFLNYTNETPR